MTAPKEPGEIGWNANADSPDADASLPKAGSGGAKAEDMPETRPPTVVELEPESPIESNSDVAPPEAPPEVPAPVEPQEARVEAAE